MKIVRIPLCFDGGCWCSEKLRQPVVLCDSSFRDVFTDQVPDVQAYPKHPRCVLEIRDAFVSGSVKCRLDKRTSNVRIGGSWYRLGVFTHAEFLKMFPGRVGYARVLEARK